jgi:alkylation response protein AidB-like acyl-CoA dehydrogenase
MMNTDGSYVDSELQAYRQQARAWLAENLEQRDQAIQRRALDRYFQHHAVGYYTPARMRANRAMQRLLFEAGYAGITWPREYGGQGLPTAYEDAFRDEAAHYVMPDFGALDSTFRTTVPTILAHAGPEFLREFIPQVLAGDILVCQFFSEPAAGSDLAGIRTRASREGDGWLLSGQKIWSTFAHLADWGLCLTRTDWDVPKHRGLTWFAVPCKTAGLTIRPIKGIDEQLEFCEAFFDDAYVPDAYRVGDVNHGWAVTQTLLVFERGAGPTDTGFALTGPGPLPADLVAVARRADRIDDPLVRQKLAQAHVNDFVGRALAWRIGEMRRDGRISPGIAGYGKLFKGTYDPIRARIAVEIGGVGAMTWDSNDQEGGMTSLAYLNGRIMSIAGGSNEMQRNGIGERVLGLPREPSFDTNKPFRDVLRDASTWVTDARQ